MSFPRHVAIFTGHRRSGYRLAIEGPPQYAFVHPDSVVAGAGNKYPEGGGAELEGRGCVSAAGLGWG